MASVVKYDSGTSHIIPAQEGAGQTFKKSDLLKFTSGQVVIATAGAIDAIAQADASGTTSATIAIEPIEFDQVYMASYKASATAQTLVGALVDFTFTAGAHTLDESGATTDALCIALDPRDAVATSGGRLLIMFMPGATVRA